MTKEPAHEAPVRPTGKVPEAVVESRHGIGMVTRPGRGFSLGELTGAGLASRTAAGWGARVDVRRRSVLEGNVALLKGWGGHPAKAPQGRVKRAEEEVKKVEAAVKREVVEIEDEVVKAEKEVKKEAVKAEKAVKAKAGKAKAKPKKKTSK